MSAALQVASSDFDRDYDALPAHIQERIDDKIYEMGRRLSQFPHERLQGSRNFRLRVGDYRVVYSFDAGRGIIYLYAVGHRREIYR